MGESPLAKLSIQGEETGLLIIVVLVELKSRRVKKYFFGQSMMRVTLNAFFSPEKQESEKVSFVKSCFEIGLLMNYLNPAQETENFQILRLHIC